MVLYGIITFTSIWDTITCTSCVGRCVSYMVLFGIICYNNSIVMFTSIWDTITCTSCAGWCVNYMVLFVIICYNNGIVCLLRFGTPPHALRV